MIEHAEDEVSLRRSGHGPARRGYCAPIAARAGVRPDGPRS
jgi:hypothetical protein